MSKKVLSVGVAVFMWASLSHAQPVTHGDALVHLLLKTQPDGATLLKKTNTYPKSVRLVRPKSSRAVTSTQTRTHSTKHGLVRPENKTSTLIRVGNRLCTDKGVCTTNKGASSAKKL